MEILFWEVDAVLEESSRSGSGIVTSSLVSPLGMGSLLSPRDVRHKFLAWAAVSGLLTSIVVISQREFGQLASLLTLCSKRGSGVRDILV